jgi:hypothetical protein
MKTAVLTAALAAIMITTLTATGCGGGGGSSNSTSTAPSLYTQSGEATLYAPLLGIYNAVWSEVGNSNTSGAAQLEFQSAVDPTAPGYNYNVIEVAVLGSGPRTRSGRKRICELRGWRWRNPEFAWHSNNRAKFLLPLVDHEWRQ